MVLEYSYNDKFVLGLKNKEIKEKKGKLMNKKKLKNKQRKNSIKF